MKNAPSTSMQPFLKESRLKSTNEDIKVRPELYYRKINTIVNKIVC